MTALATAQTAIINNDLLVLAHYLNVQPAEIQSLADRSGIRQFKFSGKFYTVAKLSSGLPAEFVCTYGGCEWAITTKRLVIINAIRTSGAQLLGYERFVGRFFPFGGNAYHGMFFTVAEENKAKIDLLHFYYNYINCGD